MPEPLIVTLEERQFSLEDRRLSIEERRLANEARGQRTSDEIAFELEMRMATSLAQSPFLPEKVGTNPNERIAAAWGVLRYANMLGVDPYVLAQQIYVVHGRVGFSAQFLIALVNGRANLKRPLDWTVSGTWEAKDLSVTCTATDEHGTQRVATMTRAQVDKWGWATKPGEPWKADPILMMRYRTASQLIRLYFAGAVMGLTMTAEELRDIERAEAIVAPAESKPRLIGQDAPGRDFVAEAEEAERKRLAALVAAPVDTEPAASPLASLPGPIAEWIDTVATEVQTDAASVVAFLVSIDRDPTKFTDKTLASARLALGRDGGKRADLLAFIGRAAK